VHRVEDRDPGTGHAEVSRTQLLRVIRRRGHADNMARFLESVKSLPTPLALICIRASRRVPRAPRRAAASIGG
jgi:hypothetical protein